MKKLMALTMVVFLAVPTVAVANGELEGEADLHSLNSSGVTGEFEFEDDGEFLRIEGTAQGLDPGVSYVSLIYDNGSNDTEADACEPTLFDPGHPDYILDTMFVGRWNVDEDGEGSLSMTNIVNDVDGTSVRVPLDKFHTISIRDLRVVTEEFGPGTGPLAVVACGVVVTDD